MEHQRDGIGWRGGVPVSRRFDDPYYSLEDGLAEARHVFLAGNDLPARFRDGFHVAELGFGTGLNLLAAWAAFRESGAEGRLRYTSFEAHPLGRADLAAAHAAFPELGALSEELAASRTGAGARRDDLELTLVAGAAETTLPGWDGRADAWFLDGFAPAKNPALWTPSLMAEVARHTRPGGTFATYTAAGHVRRALGAAGFDVLRAPGYGRKRHMTRGRLG
jgi:tRNA U34 5-methylaminomethyl-2-thiouridine-forming methyltransferase MnmC